MFKTILVPTDGSAPSRRAEDAAVMLARASGATLVTLAVAESALARPPRFLEPFEHDALLAAAQQRVQAMAARALAAGIPCQCSVALAGEPWEEILKGAADLCCDVIVMAPFGVHGPQALALGSQAQRVLANARLPVMIFR